MTPTRPLNKHKLQVGLVIYFYVASYNTVKHLVHRHLKTTQAHPGLALVSARIRNRLFKYTLLFCVMWGLGASVGTHTTMGGRGYRWTCGSVDT